MPPPHDKVVHRQPMGQGFYALPHDRRIEMDLLAKTESTTVLHSNASLDLLVNDGGMPIKSTSGAVGAGEAALEAWSCDASAPNDLGGTGLITIDCLTSGVCRVWWVVEWGSAGRTNNIHLWGDDEYTKIHESSAVATPISMQGYDCNLKLKFQPINGDLDTEFTEVCTGCIYVPAYGEQDSQGGSE